jgi:inner membrane protein
VPRAIRAYRVARVVMPPLAVLGVVSLDLVAGWRAWPIPVIGLLDEPAHLLTAGLALSAATEGRRQVWAWVLLGAVAIDVDHIPLYLWGAPVAVDGGRPVTHSLATALVLVAIAVAMPRVRTAAGALSAGVMLHLLRDAATGPGVPLFWPVLPDSAFLPYRTYLVTLLVLAAVACARGAVPLLRDGGSPTSPRDEVQAR